MINERDSIVMTARQRWLSEQDLSVPLKDNTGNIIGSVDKASGESSCVFTVVEPAAVASLRQACEGENLRYVSMGYRVKEVDPAPWQQRVIDEKAELDIKINKLATFLTTPRDVQLPADEYQDLIDQHNLMLKYSEILRRRISRFTKEVKVSDNNT